MDTIAQIAGLLMSISFAIGYIPQIIKAHRTKSTKDLSFWLVFLCITGYLSGLTYIFITGVQFWLLVNYGSGLIFSSILMIYWFLYRKG